MNNWGYREIFGFDTPNLKQLNDTLMALWAKVMGEGRPGAGVQAAVAMGVAQAEAGREPAALAAQAGAPGELAASAAEMLNLIQSLAARVSELEANEDGRSWDWRFAEE